MSKFTIAVAGNPNCGKTTLFNAFTGSKQYVGNWPGVTVEQKTGSMSLEGNEIKVVDIPGIYSFSSFSIDEKIARDFILSGEADLVVSIIDASNLERSLYLVSQLLEMRIPMIVAINMMDMAKKQKIVIEIQHLAKHLDCPVVPIIAVQKKGLDELKLAIIKQLRTKKISSTKIAYDSVMEQQLEKIIPKVQPFADKKKVCSRWLSIKLLEQENFAIDSTQNSLKKQIENSTKIIQRHVGENIDLVIADGKYGFINGLILDVINRSQQINKTVTDNIDKFVLNKFISVPLFFVIMYMVFWTALNLSGPFIDFFDGLGGTIFVDGVGYLLSLLGTPQWLLTFFSTGIGGGIQTVGTFIPPIFFIFLCLSVLEDSGYMSRVAFVMDRLMRVIGLPGKSFVPMLVGFGCTVPAIMATRTLENTKDRFLTIIMIPFMSCGARLPVYALFGAAFFPNNAGKMVFLLYLIGILLAIFTGFLMKRSLIKGEVSTFVMELPSYHIPTITGIMTHTWERLFLFIKKAGKMIMIVVVILSFLNSVGIDGTFDNQDTENSVLCAIGKTITPLFHPMGITDDNWPATVGLFTGIFAKEAIVGTLNALYKNETADKEKPEFDFWDGVESAFVALGDGLGNLFGDFSKPIDLEVAQSEQELSQANSGTFGSMRERFKSTSAAFAYLLFVLIYVPCVAAIATIFSETNLKWAVLVSFYLTILAWVVSTVFYQTVNFFAHPGSSSITIVLTLMGFWSLFYILKRNFEPISN